MMLSFERYHSECIRSITCKDWIVTHTRAHTQTHKLIAITLDAYVLGLIMLLEEHDIFDVTWTLDNGGYYIIIDLSNKSVSVFKRCE